MLGSGAINNSSTGIVDVLIYVLLTSLSGQGRHAQELLSIS